MGRSRRLAVVLAAAVAVSSAVVAGPASAYTGPQLLSVSVSANQVTAPGQVTVSYTASPDSYGSPINVADAVFVGPDGRFHPVQLTAGTSGSGTLDVPDGVANGAWTLLTVGLSVNNLHPGESETCAAGATNTGGAQCTSRMDFSADTVTVSGSNTDDNAPLISSLTVTPTQVHPGDPVTISWADDEVHTLTNISLTFHNSDPRAQSDVMDFGSRTAADLAGRQFVMPVKAYAYNGVYQLTEISISDNVGNTARYYANGTTSLTYGTVYPTSHALNFSAFSLTVTGSTQGLNPPQLTSLRFTAPKAPSTSPVQIDYTATEPTPPTDMQVTYTNAWGTGTYDAGNVPPSGRTIYLPTTYYGAYQLNEIRLQDSRGDILIYRRDGTTYNPITGATGSHSLNFPQFDLTIPVPTPQIVGAWSTPHTATVRWNAEEGGDQPLETQLTLNPGGYSVLVPVNIYDHTVPRYYTFSGLSTGVTYTITAVNIGPFNARSAPTQTTVTPRMSDHIFSVGDDNGDGRDDLVGFNGLTSTGWFYGRTGTGYSAPNEYGYWPPNGPLTPAGSPLGQGNGSVFYVDENGVLTFLQGWGRGTTGTIQPFGKGWNSMRFLVGGFDFTGDGTPDLYAVSSTGNLYLYRVQPYSGQVAWTLSISPRQAIGSGWTSMETVFSPGDFNGDHKADLMAIDFAGNLWLYPGNGRGGFAPRVQVGSGWAGFGAVFALRDFSGSGHMDVGAVDMNGNLYRYAGTGTGRLLPGRTLIGTQWNRYF